MLAREKREAWEEVERLEQRALELEVQRSAQAQEQQVQMLELRLADLQEQSHTEAGPDEQVCSITPSSTASLIHRACSSDSITHS